MALRDSSTTAARSTVAGFAFLGLLAGATHAVVESGLVRALGLQIQLGDLLLLACVFGAAGAAGMAVVGLAWTALLRRRLAIAKAGRVAVWVVGLAYVALAFKTDFARDGATGVLAWTLPGLVLVVITALWVRSGGGVARATAAFVALSAAFTGLALAAEELQRVQDDRQAPFLAVLLAVAATFLLLAIAGACLANGRVAALPVLLASATTMAAFAVGPQYYGWRATVRTPVLGPQASGGNLILIVLDTVRADHLDLFGYERETMPLLAKRARSEFDVVRTTHSPSSWTLPAHASMFTGVYSWMHGAHYPRVILGGEEGTPHPLRPDIPTLAETMANAGYSTAGIVSNYGMLSGYDIDRGFLEYHAEPGRRYVSEDLLWIYRAFRDDYYKPGFLLRGRLPEGAARATGAFNRFRPWHRRAQDIRVEASDWLDHRRQKPFFLFLNFMDAHSLYLPVKEDDGYFVERPPGAGADTFLRDSASVNEGGPGPSAEYLEYYVGQYDASMRELDRVLDSFMDELIERGLYDESMIVITSDHGEEFMEHGMLEHGEGLYETLIRVPLLVKLPASAAKDGIEVGTAMQHVDLWPTAAEVLGFPVADGIQGVAWGRSREHALSEVYSAGWGKNKSDMAAVVVDGRKLIVSTLKPMQAYDLKADPDEMSPIVPPPADLAEQGSAVAGARVFDAATELPADASPEMLDRLRSLGYIQ